MWHRSQGQKHSSSSYCERALSGRPGWFDTRMHGHVRLSAWSCVSSLSSSPLIPWILRRLRCLFRPQYPPPSIAPGACRHCRNVSLISTRSLIEGFPHGGSGGDISPSFLWMVRSCPRPIVRVPDPGHYRILALGSAESLCWGPYRHTANRLSLTFIADKEGRKLLVHRGTCPVRHASF